MTYILYIYIYIYINIKIYIYIYTDTCIYIRAAEARLRGHGGGRVYEHREVRPLEGRIRIWGLCIYVHTYMRMCMYVHICIYCCKPHQTRREFEPRETAHRTVEACRGRHGDGSMNTEKCVRCVGHSVITKC